jgi:signal transduction histidine kinase
VCREIVALHGGDISVESPEDGGTRMVVRLPLISIKQAAA